MALIFEGLDKPISVIIFRKFFCFVSNGSLVARLVLFLALAVNGWSYAQITVSGSVRNSENKETVPYANVLLESTMRGSYSNEYGFFSIQVVPDKLTTIQVSALGFAKQQISFLAQKDTTLNVDLLPRVNLLNEIVVSSIAAQDRLGKGSTGIRSDLINKMPTLLGEKDVFKAIQLLPGVKSGIEGSVGLYVRGGSPDQNLIILDEAPVYNPSHLFGFFSVFNTDAIKTVSFWKAGFPAQYGSRASSVIDIQMRDGNKRKIEGRGSIGILSSRLTLEGPLVKDKASMMVSFRRSYLDILTRPLMTKNERQSYRFFDINAKANWEIDAKNTLHVSFYSGGDKLINITREGFSQQPLVNDTRLSWGNNTSSLRWNRQYSSRLFGNITLIQSRHLFEFTDIVERSGANGRYEFLRYGSNLQDYALKNDLDWYPSNSHQLKFGLHFSLRFLTPSTFERKDSLGQVPGVEAISYRNQETAAYVEDIWQVATTTTIRSGLRINALAAGDTFLFLEPRINISHDIGNRLGVFASYTRANQFVHVLSNTGLGLSTDLWVPPSRQFPPVQTDQWSVGLTKELPRFGSSISVETYRKYFRNLLAYNDGARFGIVSDQPEQTPWQENVTKGRGLSYGTEIMIQKNSGKFSGFISYTLGWLIHQFDSLNRGERFFGRSDNRHSLVATGTFKFSTRVQATATWHLHSGIALTAPQGFHYIPIANFVQSEPVLTTVPYFGARNNFRTEAIHRLDIAIELIKEKKRFTRVWEFGVYNAYNRKNPLYYYLSLESASANTGPRAVLRKRNAFPILPMVSYNFKF
jgi:hypothetical protein